MSDSSQTKPREIWVVETKSSYFIYEDEATAIKECRSQAVYGNAIVFQVVEISALRDAEAEIARLKDTPGGKRIYAAINEIARQSEIIAELAAALVALNKWAKENHEMPDYSQVILNADHALAKLAKHRGEP